ncbi:hypothetical protein JCM10207_001626 [Rhodosporidiobolus poonsookiae]
MDLDAPAILPVTSTSAAAQHSTSPAAASRLRSALGKVEQLCSDEEAIVATRAAKRSAVKSTTDKTGTRACSACRKAKNKCINQDGETCRRCASMGLSCVYPELRARGPKKRLSKTHRLLLDIKRDIEAVLSSTSAVDLLDEDSEEEASLAQEAQDTQRSDDESAQLHNPLAVLAQKASEAAVPVPPSSPRLSNSALGERYYDGGLYLSRPETDFTLDPCEAGVLNVTDLTRLVKLYFTHLRPFCYLFLPELHSVNFLRQNSPFLSTALAYVSATFDPLSAHIAQPLNQHARRLMLDILDQGLKSIEIVQGFFILSHWSSPAMAHESDRAWSWMGIAGRMAAELRIDVPLDNLSFTTYRGFDSISLDLVNKSRQLTWRLLFCGELAISVQTGRSECSSVPPIPAAASYSPTNPPPEFADHNYAANLQLACLHARAIQFAANLRQEPPSAELRQKFQASWKSEMDSWRLRWPDLNPFIEVRAENTLLILNLMALRFPGDSAQSILAESRACAVRTIQKISSWEDRATQLPYCSNYVVVHIAYGAVLLLHLSRRFREGVSPDTKDKILRIAAVLERIGQHRSNALSFATLHAERIRRLVGSLTPESASAPPSPGPAPISWSGPPMPPVIPFPTQPFSAPQLPVPPQYTNAAIGDVQIAATADTGGSAAFATTDLDWPSSVAMLDFADLAPMMGWWGWGEPEGFAGGEPSWALSGAGVEGGMDGSM